MKKIYGFSIVSSFLGLWITSLLPESFELTLGFVLIFTFGMIHGSNDIIIVNRMLDSSKHNFFSILFSYISIVLLAVLIFYFFPIIAMTLFILFSSYHFGEQHWEQNLKNFNRVFKGVFFFSYGLLILYLIFLFNNEAVKKIIFEITTLELNNLLAEEICVVLSAVLICMLFYGVIQKKIEINVVGRELFSVLILSIIFKSSTLIWGFTIYFILWHSLPSLIDQITFIYGDLRKKSIAKYTKDALPYWIVSLVGMLVLFIIFKEEKHFYTLFFAFIAAVTFPHALVMLSMFTKKSS